MLSLVEDLVVSVSGVYHRFHGAEVLERVSLCKSISFYRDVVNHTDLSLRSHVRACQYFDAEVLLDFADDLEGVVELPV